MCLFIYFCSLGPHHSSTIPREMVSRRKILSRSRDDLHLDQAYMQQLDDEEDIWYQKEKLFKVSTKVNVFSRRMKARVVIG
jgi:hypothetical protein